ncbi:flavin-containing monooxygenase [Ornithinimicrobium cavernae]|uniref:flavin-containing monooxygenase n=1 Tax=Ornithinimicrobium cavernae TaxID=2666047 RepID=UPI000D686439|nr:NAD(P)/FAD-dependent oxidoreductase [Ornithinimicrobium cavernae]
MDDEVLIIGSGPAGLSCAAELRGRGISATVLERGPALATAWVGRYDGLRFNTSRRHSALPGSPFPRRWGQFPTRDQYLSYLQSYAEAHQVPVRTGVAVTRVDQDRDGWRLQTSAGPAGARHVIVATGVAQSPVRPGWAVDSDFAGTVLHACDYRNPQPFAGRDVVVVGAGSTGLEVAHELARGGAGQVRLAVRTPPNLLLREMGGAPTDLPMPLLLRLPPALVDRMFAGLQRRLVGDLTAYGLPPATEGPMTGLRRRGAGTAVVDKEVIEALREGAFTVEPEVTGLHHDGVRLADGRRVDCSVVILATGYATGLGPLVGHLDVLGERGMPRVRSGGESLPGLRFVGFAYRPGLTGLVGRQARAVAREIAAGGRAGQPARGGWRPPASRTPTSHDRAASRG